MFVHVVSEAIFQIHLNTDTDDMNTFLATYVERTLMYILVLIVVARNCENPTAPMKS